MRTLLLLALTSLAWADPPPSRDAYECGDELLARARLVQGEGHADAQRVDFPAACPRLRFRWPYEVRETAAGSEVWNTQDQTLLLAFARAPAPTPTPRAAPRAVARDCPSAPPGYRLVHSLVKEAP